LVYSGLYMAYKILLLSPPIHDFYATAGRCEPLGLLYIHDTLTALPDVSVELYDAAGSGRKKKIQTPACFDYLKKYYYEDTSTFSLLQNHYFRFGDSFQRISEHICAKAYDLIAITSLFSAYHPDVESLIGYVKARMNVTIVVGGWAVFAEPAYVVSRGLADYYISGEGETVLPLLVAALQKRKEPDAIDGLWARSITPPEPSLHRQTNNRFVATFPQRRQPYRFHGTRIASMITSKGCRLGCAFCSIHGRTPFVSKPLPLIADELAYLHSIGVAAVNFEDDNLFAERDYAEGLLEICSRFHRRGMQFYAMNGITAINLRPLVEQVLAAGFRELNLAMVSTDPAVLHSVHRPDFSAAIEEIAWKALGTADVLAFLIAGLPSATIASLLSDIRFLAALPLTIGFSPLYLLPGLPYFEGFTLPHERRLLRGSALYAFGPEFTRSDIASLWKYVRFVNWLKTSPDPDAIGTRENIEYFSRSFRERNWYARKKDGVWYPACAFDTQLPPTMDITDLNGKQVNQQHIRRAEPCL
jgi:radical SAM superfamily enzyme YgiQ (UPF0313 family)